MSSYQLLPQIEGVRKNQCAGIVNAGWGGDRWGRGIFFPETVFKNTHFNHAISPGWD
jgi:hypothetical protein